MKGSAQIALEIHPPFPIYIFIDKDPDRAKELETLRCKYPQREIQIVPGHANTWLTDWCATTDWHKCRAVVFLDPYGMQVDWAVVEAVVNTQAIDAWILFPLGVAVNRLLTRSSEPPPAWAKALTRILGTEAWRGAFYSRTTEQTLFGTDEITTKEPDFQKI